MLVIVRRQADGQEPWKVEGLVALQMRNFLSPSEAFAAVHREVGGVRLDWYHYRTKLFDYYGAHVPSDPRGSRESGS